MLASVLTHVAHRANQLLGTLRLQLFAVIHVRVRKRLTIHVRAASGTALATVPADDAQVVIVTFEGSSETSHDVCEGQAKVTVPL